MHKTLLAIPAILLGLQVTAMADVVPPGTLIVVRPDARVDVSHWDRGRIYPAHVARDVHAQDGDLSIPRGSQAELIVRQVGPDQFALDIESVTVNGRRYVMDASGQQFNMPRADYDSGNGLVGAIVGAITGENGEEGVARGSEIRIPPGSLLTFRLQQPFRVVNWSDPGYMQRDYHYHREHDWYR